MAARDQRSGHVIVCGADGVALRTVEQLRVAGADVVVVHVGGRLGSVAEHLLEQWGVPHAGGRARDALLDAGLAGAAAVVCMPDDDLQAMEIALLARRLRPDVRLVARVGNRAVGRALTEVLGPGAVLDEPALSSPSVVEACLGRRTDPFELGGHEFLAAELTVDRDATLRELFGDLTPLTAGGPAGGAPAVCPGRDHRVRAGDRVTLVGTPAQFAGHGLAEQVAPVQPQAAVRYASGARTVGASRAVRRAEDGRRIGLRSLLTSLAREADRPLRTALALLAALVGVSILVLRLGYVKDTGAPMSMIDAAYFTVETVATVGYGDFSFAAQAPWLRVFAIALMASGVILTTVTFALLTQLLVSRRLERSFGARRVGAMHGHVVLIGLGSVGLRVVEGLRDAGRRVVVVDRDEDGRHLGRARALGVPVVVGDGTEPAVLASANLSAAAAVAVLTSNDLANVETGLVVRDQLGARWAAVPVVLRVFDRELADTVEDGFGFTNVRSTAALAAPWFVGAALGLAVLATFYVDRVPFLVGRLSVAAGGGLDGLTMGELSERSRVLAIHRAGSGERELEHPPRRGARLGAGDDAYLIGPYEELLAVLRRDVGPAQPLRLRPLRLRPSGPQPSRVDSTPGIEIP